MTEQRLNDFSMMKERESVVTACTADMIGGAVATISPNKPISAQYRVGSKGFRVSAGAAGSEARWEPMLKAGHCRRDEAPSWQSLAGAAEPLWG
jgi:hypothetical protein